MFKNQLEALKLDNNELIPDVKTRWNSTYYMIRRVLELRKVCDICNHHHTKKVPFIALMKSFV